MTTLKSTVTRINCKEAVNIRTTEIKGNPIHVCPISDSDPSITVAPSDLLPLNYKTHFHPWLISFYSYALFQIISNSHSRIYQIPSCDSSQTPRPVSYCLSPFYSASAIFSGSPRCKHYHYLSFTHLQLLVLAFLKIFKKPS